MKTSCRYILTLSASIALLMGNSCTPGMAGATTETTNGAYGRIVTKDMTPAVNAIVKLIPSEFNPVDQTSPDYNFTDTTDAGGNYSFSRMATGTYCLIARSRETLTSMLKNDITIDTEAVTSIPDGILGKSGSVTADFSLSESASNGYVYIPGTDIYAPVADNGLMVLDDIPSGTISKLYFVDSAARKFNILRTELTVEAGKTVTLEQPLWKYKRRITLNTTATGAAISGDVPGFPLLVRLDTSRIDFSQSLQGGKDLLFTSDKGTVLTHEIERWDEAAKKAQVWVLIDTVYGSDSTQSITMYWGNPAAIVSADKKAVFAATEGYTGVWHLSGDGNDVTPNRNNAAICTPANAEGIIGLAKQFSGNDSIQIPSLQGMPQRLTLSAWARLDSMPQGAMGAEIVSIGDGCLLRMDDMESDTFGVSGSFHLKGESAFQHVCSGLYHKNSGWHYYAVVFDCVNRSHDLFIDGELRRHIEVADTINYSNLGAHTLIGVHGNGKHNYNFIGRIDEVRIRDITISKDRIRLEYMNQKAIDGLVVFEK